MVVSVALTVGLLASAYDPLIDQALDPKDGMALSAGVQRLQDDFGLAVHLATPRFFGGHMAVAVAGGVAWFPDLRALPMNAEDQSSGAWSMYGHARVTIEASARIAPISGRVYARVGPSALFLLADTLSSKRFAFGVYGAVGAELFAGDAYSTYPFSFFFEIGGTAHDAKADVSRRVGGGQIDATVDRPIATGLALAGGVRIYFW